MKKLDKDSLHAKVVVEFLFPYVCCESDLKDTGMTFEEMVRHLIKEEGLFGVVDEDEDYKIIKIERAK